MNTYAAEDEWVLPSATLSYHATLESHHHSQPPQQQQQHHTHAHSHGHSSSTHAHTYPSQHIGLDHVASTAPPMLESRSFSQDRESESHDDNDASAAASHSMSTLPSYQLAALCSIPTQTSGFKRPYQPDTITPASSPQPSTKRRKSTSKEAWTMTEDDNLLLQLKDDEGLPWKVIAQRFREMNRGEFRVPTLQMRYKRLKEKMRVWDADDVQYLKEAKEYVEKQKWELISQRMVELGCKKKIPGTTCEKKWKEIAPQPLNTQQTPGSSGPNSATSSGGSATSLTSDGLAQACDMKRELSQVSEEDVEGLGVSVDGLD